MKLLSNRRALAIVAATAVVVAGISAALFTLMCGGFTSEVSDNALSEDEIINEQLDSISAGVDEVEEAYLDEEGYVAPEIAGDALRAVEAYAQKRSDIVVGCENSGTSVLVELKCGFDHVYTPNLEGALSSGENSSIFTYEPYWANGEGGLRTVVDMEKEGFSDASNSDLYAWYVSEQFDEYSFSQEGNVNDSDVSVESFKSFGKDSLVIYCGHGCWTEKYGSGLTSGVEASKEIRSQYKDDFKMGRLAEASNHRVIVQPSFFDYYCSVGSMSGSFMILQSCGSLRDDRLAKVFVDKGARVVVGYDASVTVSYGDMMTRSLLGYEEHRGLTDFPEEGGAYYTFAESLQFAQEECGVCDPIAWPLADMDGAGHDIYVNARCVCYPESVAAEARLSDALVAPLKMSYSYQAVEAQVEVSDFTNIESPTKYESSWTYPQFICSRESEAVNRVNVEIKSRYDVRASTANPSAEELRSGYLNGEMGGKAQCISYDSVVAYLDGGIASVREESYCTNWGAHGWREIAGLTYDLSSGEEVSAANVVGLTQQELSEAAKKAIRTYLKANPSDYHNDSTDIEKHASEIVGNPNRYYVTKAGVAVIIQSYDFGSYAWGCHDVICYAFDDRSLVGTEVTSL